MIRVGILLLNAIPLMGQVRVRLICQGTSGSYLDTFCVPLWMFSLRRGTKHLENPPLSRFFASCCHHHIHMHMIIIIVMVICSPISTVHCWFSSLISLSSLFPLLYVSSQSSSCFEHDHHDHHQYNWYHDEEFWILSTSLWFIIWTWFFFFTSLKPLLLF